MESGRLKVYRHRLSYQENIDYPRADIFLMIQPAGLDPQGLRRCLTTLFPRTRCSRLTSIRSGGSCHSPAAHGCPREAPPGRMRIHGISAVRPPHLRQRKNYRNLENGKYNTSRIGECLGTGMRQLARASSLPRMASDLDPKVGFGRNCV